MELVDIIASAQNGRGLESIGRQFGLSEAQTRAALDQLAPAIAAGVRRNTQSPQGMANLLRALQTGDHQRYIEQDDAAAISQARTDGNAILGHVFGSKDVSREVAMQASGSTGIGSSILKQLLPIIASMVLGALTKKMTGGAQRAPRPQPQQDSGGGLGDILGDILGGGSGQARRSPGGGLDDIFGDILGGGRSTGTQGGGLEDILGDILGGGRQDRRGPAPQMEEPDMNYNEDSFKRGRDALDDFLGRGSPSGNAADDLLDSVNRRVGRR